VISRPAFEPVPWRGATGHVQDVWTNGVLEQACGFRPRPDTHVFLCGSPDMIESMTELLAREGFQEHARNTPGQVHVERYWPKKTGTGPAVPVAVEGQGVAEPTGCRATVILGDTLFGGPTDGEAGRNLANDFEPVARRPSLGGTLARISHRTWITASTTTTKLVSSLPTSSESTSTGFVRVRIRPGQSLSRG